MNDNNDEQFWIKNIKYLFGSTKLIPRGNDSLEVQVNSLTRFILILFVVLFCINPKYDLIFFVTSLLFLIIIYYVITNKKMTKENFEFNNNCNDCKNNYVPIVNNCESVEFDPPQSSLNHWQNGGESYYAQQSLNYRQQVCQANGCKVDPNNYQHCVNYDEPIEMAPPQIISDNLNKSYQSAEIGSNVYYNHQNQILDDINKSNQQSFDKIDAYYNEQQLLKTRQNNYNQVNVTNGPYSGQSGTIQYKLDDNNYVLNTDQFEGVRVPKSDMNMKPEYAILDDSILKFKEAENNFVGNNPEKVEEQSIVQSNEMTKSRLLKDIKSLKTNIREARQNINKTNYVISHNKGNQVKIDQAEKLKEEYIASISNNQDIIREKEALIRQIDDYVPGGPENSICPNLKTVDFVSGTKLPANQFTSECVNKNGKNICYIDNEKVQKVLNPCAANPKKSNCDQNSTYASESDCTNRGRSLQENFKLNSQFKQNVPNLTVRNGTGQGNPNANTITITNQGSGGTSSTVVNNMYQNNANPYKNSVNLDRDIIENPNYVSTNQILAGNPNVKTEQPTIIAPPLADQSNWKPTDFINHSQINVGTNYDFGRSGYLVDNDCNVKFKELQNKTNLKQSVGDIMNTRSIEDFKQIQQGAAIKLNDNRILENNNQPTIEHFEGKLNGKENATKATSKGSPKGTLHKKGVAPCSVKNFPESQKHHLGDNPHISLIDDLSHDQDIPAFPEYNNYVNTSMGYYPDNLDNNIPVNLAVGEAEKKPQFKDYNKQLYSSIIQPGVYTETEVIEPVMSNIGISYPQQRLPYVKNVNENGDITYNYKDPYSSQDVVEERCENAGKYVTAIGPENVFDPRSFGYGTSYRSYIDNMTGQPRFYYDDIDAIRQPNYITRNDLDTFDFGTSYGPMTEGEFMAHSGENIRGKADNRFMEDSIDFRNDLQQSMMRKNISRNVQLKRAPLRN